MSRASSCDLPQSKMGTLQIPLGTYYRSVSGTEGSIVLNQAVRDSDFNPINEFKPVRLRHRPDLQKAKADDPVFWIWDDGKIRRLKVGGIESGKKKITA